MQEEQNIQEEQELYENYRVIVDKGQSLLRIDKYLVDRIEGASRNKIQLAIKADCVKVNDKTVKVNYRVKPGDLIQVFLTTEPREIEIIPQNIPIDIVYEDKDVIVVNKPAGMVVHPGYGNYTSTLLNALTYHFQQNESSEVKPLLVHRIDKDTSGLLVVAKNDIAHKSLAEQIEQKTCKRTYIALLEGVLKQDQGEIETYIDRSKKDKTKMEVSDSGRIAKTFYKVLQRYESYTLVEFNLHTGRTHQIRVHSKYIMHPVVGDDVYGYKKQKFNLKGQLLHAYKLKFVHPTTNKEMEFSCDIPEHFLKVLASIENTKINNF